MSTATRTRLLLAVLVALAVGAAPRALATIGDGPTADATPPVGTRLSSIDSSPLAPHVVPRDDGSDSGDEGDGEDDGEEDETSEG